MFYEGKNVARVSSLVAGLSLAGLIATSANAGVVALGTSGWQAEWDASLDGLVTINFVEQLGGAVFIQKSAQFNQGPVNGIFPSIPIVFRQIALSNVTNIVIDDEIILNNTGSAWTDFHIDLLDSGNAVFNPGMTAGSGGGGPIGFSISPFTQAAFTPDNMRLDIWGGVVQHGELWFPGDGATDGQLWIDVVSGGQGNFTVFTLKETPTPAPGALALLGLGAIFGSSRRRS
jgi:MYXO-CTERM domain-containing protein